MNAATANLAGITGLTRRLVIDGVLSEEDARKALEEATKAKKQAHVYLLEQRLINVSHIAAANSTEFGIPLFDPSAMDLRFSAHKLISEDLITKHQALPLLKRGNRLYVAIADPTNTRALDEIKFAANVTVEPILVDEDRLRRAIDQTLVAGEDITKDMGDDEGLENLESSGGDDEMADSTGAFAEV